MFIMIVIHTGSVSSTAEASETTDICEREAMLRFLLALSDTNCDKNSDQNDLYLVNSLPKVCISYKN